MAMGVLTSCGGEPRKRSEVGRWQFKATQIESKAEGGKGGR